MPRPKADWLVVVVGAVVGVALALSLPILLDLKPPVDIVMGDGSATGAWVDVKVLGTWHFTRIAPRNEDL